MTVALAPAPFSPRSRPLPGADPRLETIVQKVHEGRRLSRDDGLLLFATPDIWTVCALADLVRRRMHGEVAYYNVNRHVNYSNICALSCKFCAFHRKKDQDGAYEFSIEQIRDEALKAASGGATELHIVGGLHPWLPFSYYTDMLSAIRAATPRLHIKAFTAVEIVHLARISKRWKDRVEGIKSVLRDLKEAGLGSLPGGGAEVFDDRVHDEAYKGKIRSDEWLDVHRAAHELGLNTNATILYGHIEQRSERIHHMLLLRAAQDIALHRLGYEAEGIEGEGIEASRHHGIEAECAALADWPGPVVLTKPGAKLPMPPLDRTLDAAMPLATMPSPSMPRCLDASMPSSWGGGGGGGGYFQTIIPLPFFPNESALEHLPGPTGLENLRTLAVARLMLDNFPHVKAFWIMQTLSMAQFMLQNGADDIDGTVVWYDITKLTPAPGRDGVDTHQETTVWELQKAIREAGFRPVERDTLYRPIARDSADPMRWRLAAV